MAYAPHANDPELIAAVPVAHAQRRLLYAGRILMIGGCLVLTYTIGGGNRAANAGHTLVGLVLLLLGVFLIMLALVASQFPGMARAGTAIADAVLFYFCTPPN